MNKVRRFITFPTPLALNGKHSTQSMTSAFCFLLGNTYGVPLVIHGGAPGETTQKHTHSFSNMFLWQWKALHSVNDFYLASLGDPGKDGTDGVPGVNGTDGVPGVNGTDGVPGSKGR